jgi:cleavage and polyadenylation specificity factor subunit 1
MDVYNQFVLPTTSLLSVYCNFTGENDDNLVISKGNLLQIFRIVDVNSSDDPEITVNASGKSSGAAAAAENLQNGGAAITDVITTEDAAIAEKLDMPEYNIEKEPIYKLFLISEYTLNGKILDIHKFRPNVVPDDGSSERKTESKVDYLLVSTETAKISVVKWNPSDHLMSVVSLHYYESVLDSLLMEKLKSSDVSHRTDPNGGCCIMFVEDLFVFLPFSKSDGNDDDLDLNDDYDPAAELEKTLKGPEDALKIDSFFLDSFILNAKTLHPDLNNIVDVQFLHSYTNPTIAIMYAPETLSWAGYLPRAKDNLKVIVLSLDLEKKSADIIIEVTDLPYDLEHIIPLQEPINGFLLLGSNEVIHINSLGSAKGIYVNEYFPKTSEFSLKDQSELDLFLELSQICQISEGESLLITKEGSFYTLIFDEIGGVSSLNRIVENEKSTYADVIVSSALHITKISNKNILFVCCEGSDALLVNWSFYLRSKMDTGSKAGIANDIYDGDEDFWLYEEGDNENNELSTSLINSKFALSDRLLNIGPLSDFTMGTSSVEPKSHGLLNPNYRESTIFASCGHGKAGSISSIAPSVKPIINSSLKFSNASKIWTIINNKGVTEYLVTTDLKSEKTQIFEVEKDYKEVKPKDFKGKSFTIQMGTVMCGDRRRIVQVLVDKVVVYHMAFGQQTSMASEKEINHSVIDQNYIVLMMKSGEIEVLEYDDVNKSLHKMDLPALLNFQIFTNAWVSRSSLLNHATPNRKRSAEGAISGFKENRSQETLFWLVTADNRLLVFRKDHLEKVFEFKNIHKMPEYLQLTNMDPNYEADVDPILKQCIYTQLGDQTGVKNYMIILTFGGELVIYETFFDPSQQCFRFIKSNDLFQIPISGAPANSYSFATKIERNLFKIDNLNGTNVVMVTGAMPFMIYKQYNSCPRMFKFTCIPYLYFAPFSHGNCLDGLITIDDRKSCRMVQLDFAYDYSNKLPISKHCIGETINKISYHELTNTFVISTLKSEKYKLLDADGEDTIEYNKDLRKPAQNLHGCVKLVSPTAWTVIDALELEENETCITLNCLNLKNNGTDGNRIVIFVGTGIFQNEDVPTLGAWRLIDLINVVPEPDKPEAKHKMKVLSKEVSRGPVLDACGIDGRFGVIQGQRMLVRMIKNDGSAIPVAFTDTSLYSSKVKAFENFVLVGDSFQSLSVYGFDAEPYRMLSLSKDEHEMNLNECEFIVHNQNLFVIAADEHSVLHVMQYDPYDASSLKGHRLVRKTAFRSNAQTTKMINVSRRTSLYSMVSTLPIRSDVDLGYEVIGSNIDGSFYKVSPINEYQYRRLYSLQNFIADKEHHWLGLNPKMNATGNLSEDVAVIKRPFIEYKLLTRFSSMSEEKKKLFAMRLGKDALVDIYRDLISLQ